MATHDYVIDNSTGANVRSDINNALLAIVSNNSSSSEPSTKYAYMWWADTTNGILKIRNSANDGWVELLQLDGTLTLEDGTASAPALAFRDDLNTGIFSSASDHFEITTGGTERVSFGTAGVAFNDDGNDYDFRIEGDTNQNLFFVDASTDKVGIGTGAPADLFHCNLAAENGSIARFGLSGQTNNQMLIIKADDSDSLFTFRFGSSNSTYPAIRFNMGADEEAMRLDSSGRLLINTSTVGTKGSASPLQVQTSNTAASSITIKNRTSHNDYSFIYFTDDDASEDLVQIGVQRTAASEGDIAFYTNDGSTASQERLRIDSIGHVEISTEVAANGNVGLQLDTSSTSNASSLLFQAGGENRAQLLVQRVAGDGGYVALQVARTDNSNSLVNVFTTTPSTSGDTTPDLTLAGNLVLASGNGIDFSATGTGTGTSSTAEIFKDYEEGSFTLALGGTWTSNPTSLAGGYVKIGRMVHIFANFAGGSKSSLTSGYFQGLPFATTNYGTGAVVDSNVADQGNALFFNTDRIWVTDNSFNSTTYITGQYTTDD